MKQQLIGKYIGSLGHIILISSQSVFTPSAARLAEKQHILISLSFVWSGSRIHDINYEVQYKTKNPIWYEGLLKRR
jgi:hypothetical protein